MDSGGGARALPSALTVYHAAGISERAPVFLLFDVVREGQLASLAKPALVSKPREGSFGGFEGGRSLRPAAGGCAVAREEGFSGAQRPEVEGEDERREEKEEEEEEQAGGGRGARCRARRQGIIGSLLLLLQSAHDSGGQHHM